MQNRRQHMLMVVVFGTVVLSLLASLLVFPSQAASTLENRELAQKPSLPTTIAGLGDYFGQWDRYLADQIPFRDTLVKAYYFTQVQALGKRRIGGVALGQDGYLLTIPASFPGDRAALDERIENSVALAEQLDHQMSAYGGHALFVGIPEKASFERHRYPPDLQYPPLRDAAEREFLAALATRQVAALDLWTVFDSHRDQQLYYKTDHHWTFAGAYLGYMAIMAALGLPALEQGDLDYIELPNPFIGSENNSIGGVISTDDRFSIGIVKNSSLTATCSRIKDATCCPRIRHLRHRTPYIGNPRRMK
jgi:hypothetical protein